MTQMDIQCIRKSIQERIGSKIKISSNKGRHKFVTSQGVITETYPNIFLVEIEDDSSTKSKTAQFQLSGCDHERCQDDAAGRLTLYRIQF